MVDKGAVLFTVKDLQQSGGRVPFIVVAEFVNFVKQDERIAALCLFHNRHDSAGHGADIGFSVSSDFCFIMNATQGNTDIFPSDRTCDGFCNGGFADTGRSDETNDLTCNFRIEFSDSQHLNDAVFYFIHAEMVIVKYFSDFFKIEFIFGVSVPW
ncbi:hypothetical protein SDC9_116817 [bioreactor metagenome]|uniref:Uncharacterized protein n=1 Tax=bioreactor metagenome TaxID=1076179 RepID=A0A645BWU7_9ZZZZ